MLSQQTKDDNILKSILESTASETGESFFCSLVKNLSRILKTCGAWVTEYDPQDRKLKALAFWLDNQYIEKYEYEIKDTPCEASIEKNDLLFIRKNVLGLYPNAQLEKETGSVGYIGVPLYDVSHNVIGHLAVIDRKPIPENPNILTIFKLFANRAAAELRRLKVELTLKEKNERLESLVLELEEMKADLIESESRFRSVAQSANDAIITSDYEGNITFWNRRAEIMFGYSKKEALGRSLTIIMPERYRTSHTRGFQKFMQTGKGTIIGQVIELHAINKDGYEFPIELTLSDWHTDSGTFVTGIIRDITLRKQEQVKLEEAHALLAAEDERKTAEFEKARQLQISMLPSSIPEMKKMDVEVFYETAIEVGGDYYDIIPRNGEETIFIVGDAAGHGLEPGMVVATVKSLIASLIHISDLAKIYYEANVIFKNLNLGRLFMALEIIRIKDDTIEICSGGMPPVLIYRKAVNSVEELIIAAPPLGGIRNYKYTSLKKIIHSGDVVLLQTDGFIERMNRQNQIFGYERTMDLFQSLATCSAKTIIEKMIAAGEKWAEGIKQDDDITMMAVRIL